MLSNFKNTEKGFTLVEALMAVSIFSLSVVTLMSVLGSGLAQTNYAKRKTTAVYLAQEGVEVMRNLRDTYMLFDPAGWSNFQNKLTTSQCMSANGCFYNDASVQWNGSDQTQPIIDMTMTACTGPSPTNCTNGALLYNASTGKYGFTGSASGFTRRIRAVSVNPSEIEIFSTVFWIQGSGNYQMTFSESLFDWTD